MMVGDPFSGKTKVLEVLAETLNLLMDRGYDDENVNKVLRKSTYAFLMSRIANPYCLYPNFNEFEDSLYMIYRDYFMVGERVRFLFTSCGESQTNKRVFERVSLRFSTTSE